MKVRLRNPDRELELAGHPPMHAVLAEEQGSGPPERQIVQELADVVQPAEICGGVRR